MTTSTRRARKSYADRTGMNTRAAKILAEAVIVKPETFEDEDGNVIRVWKSSEMSSWGNKDLAPCLTNRVAVEPNELLGAVPPSALKFAVTKGWLIPNANRSLFRVTLKAAIDLDLPLKFRGGDRHGRKIPFAS